MNMKRIFIALGNKWIRAAVLLNTETTFSTEKGLSGTENDTLQRTTFDTEENILRASIWDRSGIRLDTKLKVYRSVVLLTLSYACETWTVCNGMPKDWTTSIQAVLENL